MWTCPKCGAKVAPSFEVCWACGTSPEGVEDPTFVRADEAPPIEDEPVAPPSESGPAARIDRTDAGDELVPCYQALSLMEAKFLADQLVAEGIPSVSDELDLQDALGPWDGNPRVYVRAEDLPRARAWLAEYDRKHKSEPRP